VRGLVETINAREMLTAETVNLWLPSPAEQGDLPMAFGGRPRKWVSAGPFDGNHLIRIGYSLPGGFI